MESFLCIFRSDSPRLWYANLRTLLDPKAEPREREYPLGWERIVLLGSCRGVLCVANVADGQVALWSPTTGTCNILPRPADARIAILGPTACVYGFGFDDKRNEHVLLRLVQTLQSPIVSAVSIYRPSAGGWRWVQRILPYYLVESGMGVYVDASLHWIMRREWEQNSARVLVYFSLRTDRFEKVDLPDDIDGTCRMDLTVLGERNCLIIYGEPGVIDVWILEYNWNRLFWLREQWPIFQTFQPLTFSWYGNRVLVEVGSEIKTLHLYNINTREAQQFHINGMPRFFDAATRLESR